MSFSFRFALPACATFPSHNHIRVYRLFRAARHTGLLPCRVRKQVHGKRGRASANVRKRHEQACVEITASIGDREAAGPYRVAGPARASRPLRRTGRRGYRVRRAGLSPGARPTGWRCSPSAFPVPSRFPRATRRCRYPDSGRHQVSGFQPGRVSPADEGSSAAMARPFRTPLSP